MHIGCVGGHFEEEYTPEEYVRRGANASLSTISAASARKTASTSAAPLSVRPRTRTEPCAATTARSASRCADAQRAASPGASTRSIGGFPDCTSTSSSDAGDSDDISVSFQSADRLIAVESGFRLR